jgi:hypothetical protein
VAALSVTFMFGMALRSQPNDLPLWIYIVPFEVHRFLLTHTGLQQDAKQQVLFRRSHSFEQGVHGDRVALGETSFLLQLVFAAASWLACVGAILTSIFGRL